MSAEHKIVSFAQNREDVILAAFFPDVEKGFYVDIGAHHPTYNSVTKYFYNKGWRGINIEPNKEMYQLLTIERPDDINVNVGIANKKGKLTLRVYEDGDGLSTFSEEMKKGYTSGNSNITDKYHDDIVDVMTLKDLFDKHKVKTIHFLKIDIEGYEYNALVGNDWDKYKPEIICIEANHIVKNWKPVLSKAGYSLVFFDGLNEYYSCSKERSAAFSYTNFALGENVIFHRDHQRILKHKNAANILRQELAGRDAVEHELMREIVYRDNLLTESKRFRNAVRNLIQATDKIFMIQISRLNHPKRKHASRNIKIGVDINKLSTQELLRTARKIDFQNYYTFGKGSGSFQGQYFYKTVLTCYKVSKKIIRFPLVVIVRTIRKFKDLGRKNG